MEIMKLLLCKNVLELELHTQNRECHCFCIRNLSRQSKVKMYLERTARKPRSQINMAETNVNLWSYLPKSALKITQGKKKYNIYFQIVAHKEIIQP